MFLKYTWCGQLLSALITHLELSFLFFVLWIFSISLFETTPGGIILTVIFVLIFAFTLYNASYQAEKNDAKSYTKLEPKWYKGALLPTFILGMNVICIVSYLLVWKFACADGGLTSLWAVAVNAVSLFWFAPYQKLVPLEAGTIGTIGYVCMFTVPILSCFLGYYAGYKNFDLTEKLHKFTYEKKK